MSDRPTTPSSNTPPNAFDASCRFEDNGLACEWAEAYRPGGLHPVQLGDVLDDGRYRIIRKIGYGAFSTVWLGVDNQMTRFVALKITKARLSDSANRELDLYQRLASGTSSSASSASSSCFAGLLDSFQINGPNGVHTTFVFEPLGPHLGVVLDATPEFHHGSLFKDNFFIGVPETQRFPKELGKRILRNVLHGLQYLHAYNGVVHGDLHTGNILVTTRPLECNAGTIAELQQRPEDGACLERLDGKQDLWAPPYQLVPAGLLNYTSAELDPYVKIADIGGSFHVDEPPTKIVTPPEFRAPETLLGLPVGTGIDIWSFGCLAFLIITGHHLFAPNSYLGSEDAIRDMNLIQFSEVIGPLPETLFKAWERGASYFTPDGKVRLKDMVADGEDGTFQFMGMDSDVESQSEEEGDEEEGGGALRQNDYEHEENAGSEISEAWSGSTTDEEPLIIMARCHSLEQRFREKKPDDIDEAEEQQIVHLLRWVFQHDAAKRPRVDEISNHPWFQT